MNPHSVCLIGCSMVLTTLAATAQAETTPVPYHYGMPMDIQKVIAMTEPETRDCRVIEAQITFVDKAGEVRQVSYKKLSEACLFQN